MFDDRLMFQMLFGGGGSGDWTMVLALAVVGTIHFLCPVLGYSTRRRGWLTLSLWLLAAKLAAGFLRHAFFSMELVDGGGGGMFRGGGPELRLMLAFLTLLDSGLFAAGMFLFVLGLVSLRRDGEDAPVPPRPRLREDDLPPSQRRRLRQATDGDGDRGPPE